MLNYGIPAVFLGIFGYFGYFGWKFTARNAYESARYSVVRTEGEFEVRDYADLILVSTSMQFDAQGNDGSFSRLFRYISGDNGQQQKVAMTTPVFMQKGVPILSDKADTSGPDTNGQRGRMAFVVPEEVAAGGAPVPGSESVQLRERAGGKFAALRFAGRMGDAALNQKESELREWMQQQNLTAVGPVEYAGYDPPWTPGFLRRNEILIRVE
ncbi:heme-binding protein [bacterium]|nr:heme-binding protein [bacterium]